MNMSKIELESEGVFCPQCGSLMKPFGPKSRKQYRCLEDPEHYATDNKIKNYRKIILK
jgi:DNA-directed RNA polymerase subunit M/transcription elongation factor TFIIS